MEAILERLDLIVVVAYMILTLIVGAVVSRGSQTAEGYTVGNRDVPGWLMSFAVFATFVSSITFLGQPSAAYTGTWNFFLFSLTLPPAAVVASRFFVPLFRQSNRLSAYELLEERFGYWARLFADLCFVAHQLLRVASISVFMALAVGPMLKLPIIPTLLVVSGTVIVYDVLGGIKAVIWTDFFQTFILAGGAIWCLVALVSAVPGGVQEVVAIGQEANKFSFSSIPWYGLMGETALVMVLYGIVDNLRNFGVDQNYVQKMLAARSDRGAAAAVWASAFAYIPTTFLFLSIGTALFAYYSTVGTLPEGTRADQVFPHYITTELPKPAAGLVIAALLAAGMSTIDSNLNSLSTVFLVDVVRRFKLVGSRIPEIYILRGTTIAFGILATALAIPLTRPEAKTLFDRWLGYAGMAGFPLLGIFLMAWLMPRLASGSAAVAAASGVPLIVWGLLPEGTLAMLGLADYPWPINSKLVGVAALVVMLSTAFLLLVLTILRVLPTNPRMRAR